MVGLKQAPSVDVDFLWDFMQILSQALIKLLWCKGAGHLLLRGSTLIVARTLSVLLFVYSAWLVLLGTVEATGEFAALKCHSLAC